MKKTASLLSFVFLTIVFFTQCNNQSQHGEEQKKDSKDVTKNWKIGVQMWTFHLFPFVTALEKADSAGVKYIEAFPGQELGGGMKGDFGIDMPDSTRAKDRKSTRLNSSHVE